MTYFNYNTDYTDIEIKSLVERLFASVDIEEMCKSLTLDLAKYGEYQEDGLSYEERVKDAEEALNEIDPEFSKEMNQLAEEFDLFPTHKVETFIPTKENCGCSGRELLHSGHKCGFFN